MPATATNAVPQERGDIETWRESRRILKARVAATAFVGELMVEPDAGPVHGALRTGLAQETASFLRDAAKANGLAFRSFDLGRDVPNASAILELREMGPHALICVLPPQDSEEDGHGMSHPTVARVLDGLNRNADPMGILVIAVVGPEDEHLMADHIGEMLGVDALDIHTARMPDVGGPRL
jgi:hypothetical protein